jgi:hypothetical protein
MRAIREEMMPLFSHGVLSHLHLHVGRSPGVVPARRPLLTSAFLTHSLSVCGSQPIFAEINMIADLRDLCCPDCPEPSAPHVRGLQGKT